MLIALARMWAWGWRHHRHLVGVAIGVAIVLPSFRPFAPSQVFPISYRRGRAAHLDVGGARGRHPPGPRDQLGLEIEEVELFGLAGSAGSTRCASRSPATRRPSCSAVVRRSTCAPTAGTSWAASCCTAGWRTRRPSTPSAGWSDKRNYALHKLYLAGRSPHDPTAAVELTPEREYLLVTEFFAGATELGEAEVDDQGDRRLGIIRKLWDAGLAHRDIKPASLLVRDDRCC